jgi:hypothetical protein
MVYEFIFRDEWINGIEIEGDLYLSINNIKNYIEPPLKALLVTINNKVTMEQYHMVRLSDIQLKNDIDKRWLDEIKYEYEVLLEELV